MSEASSPSPSLRDRDLRRLRASTWAVAAGATVVTAGFSVAAAHAFKGHDGTKQSAMPAREAPAARARVRVRVPPPQHVPSIAGEPAPLQAPAQPPAPAPQAPAPTAQAPAPAPAPPPPTQTSGGS